MKWLEEGEGPQWVPVLNAAELRHGIPANLLAHIAYRESRFRADYITGQVGNAEGGAGLMQLHPSVFPQAGKNPTADIESAAVLLASLHERYTDWPTAVAAYKGGTDLVDAALQAGTKLPAAVLNFVSEVLTMHKLAQPPPNVEPAPEPAALAAPQAGA